MLNIENPGDWDGPVSKHLIDEWAATIMEGIESECLQFQRSTTPANPVKLPKIVGFWDGSSQAYAAAVYI